jgi:cytochrome c oxidase subunit 1
MAGVFGLFMATYYWFPLLCGRKMNETLGRWHFWLSIIGAYATFLPMHVAGLMGSPRHYAQFQGLTAAAGSLLTRAMPVQRFVTYSAVLLASAQVIFLVNVFKSLRRGERAGENPWNATTLEWMPLQSGSRLAASNEKISVVRGPCAYLQNDAAEEFVPQWAVEKKAE